MEEEAENNLPTKHLRSFWSFWLHGFKKAFKKSWEKYNHALAAFVILYLIAAAFLQKWGRLSQWVQKYHKDFDMSLWVQLIIPVALLLIFLGWHFSKAPYEIYKEIYDKTAKEISNQDKNLSRIQGELKAIQATKPNLILMPTFSDRGAAGNYFCRVAVKNNSLTGTANHVKVELIRIDPSPELTTYSYWAGDVPYPLSLKPSEPDGRTIHPNCVSKFDVLMVSRITTDFVKGQHGKEVFLSLTADFVGRPRLLEESPDLPRFNLGHFKPALLDENKPELGFKEYYIKIRVSAEGVPAIEKTFNVSFFRDLAEDAVQIINTGILEKGTGNLGPEAADELENCSSFSEMSDDLCNRLMRSKTSLLKFLHQAKAAQGKDKCDTNIIDKQ